MSWWGWSQDSLSIGPAGLEHASTLAQLHGAAFDRQWSKQEFADLLRRETTLALLARQRTRRRSLRPAGFLMLQRTVSEAEILSIAVAGNLRRRGIARAMMDEAIRRLYAEHQTALFLEVDTSNIAAVNLYRQVGFQVVGERKGYYQPENGSATTALVMRCDLR
jgi:ribosomal-protein-alanine N-acetyltransferase